MIPVNVLSSRLMLVVSVGPVLRTADLRTRHANMSLAVATATTPLRHTTPHPPAHPRLSCPRFRGAPEPTRPPLQPHGCYASLTRPAFGRPLTPEPLRPLAQQLRAGQRPAPADTGAPRKRGHDSLPGGARGHHQPTFAAHTCPKTGQANRKTTTLDHKPVDQHPARLTSRFI
jgi:hypothetical protein